MIDKLGQIVIKEGVIEMSFFHFSSVTIEEGRREALEWALEVIENALSDETNFMPTEFDICQAAIDIIKEQGNV